MGSTQPHTEDTAHDFLDVFAAERQTIAQQRAVRSRLRSKPIVDQEITVWRQIAVTVAAEGPDRLSGLALSGGGIRSATFNLGVLQALDRFRVLGFDYLSTVSGGGYIGGWWSAWVARNPGSPFPPEEGIETWRGHAKRRAGHPVHVPTPDPIHHVRLFSNYLTPRKGVMSRDLWRAVTVVTRNLLITWTALLPVLASAVMLAQAAFIMAYYRAEPGRPLFGRDVPGFDEIARRFAVVIELPLAFLAWFVAIGFAWLMWQRGNTASVRDGRNIQWLIVLLAALCLAGVLWTAIPPSPRSIFPLLSVPVIGIAAWRIWFGGARPAAPEGTPQTAAHEALYSRRDRQINRLSRLQGVALVAALVTFGIELYAAFAHEIVKYAFFGDHGPIERWIVGAGKYLTILGALGSGAYTGMKGAPKGGAEAAPAKASRWGALVIRVAPVLVIVSLLLLTGWVSHSAFVTLVPTDGWLGVFRSLIQIGIVTMVVLALLEGCERPRAAIPAGALLLTAVSLATAGEWNALSWGWTGALAAALGAGGILAVAHYRHRNVAHSHDLSRAEWLLAGASVAGVVMAAFGADFTTSPPEARLLLSLVGCLWTAVMLIGWTADPNMLSLHTFYKMRLVRAYLGASNPRRTAHHAEDVTETKPGDDVLLQEIAADMSPGPYHLINGTLNLTTGSDLVIAQRAAAPFLFSRHYCGSPRTGFRSTSHYKSGTLTVGTAVAVSGAAASPIMGSQTPSTALSMLFTFLNVRLGYWTPTPNMTDWRATQARLWPFYVLREFFAHTADTGPYCYVTDGGHFDNTGVYSLVERGCSSIVLCDCGADPDCVFDDLSNLVRRCRIDFAADIRFPDLSPFTTETLAADRRHFVTGYIRYNRVHLLGLGWKDQQILDSIRRCPSEVLRDLGWEDIRTDGDGIGVIVVIKPTLANRLETDVRRYSQQHADFPQQTTGDQWFDEAQFESYRRLGEVSGHAAVAEIRKQFPEVVF